MTQEMAVKPEKTGKGGRNRQQRAPKKSPAAGKGEGTAPKKVTYPWINSQIITAAETGNLNYLVATVDAHLPEMNLVNLSTALHRLSKMTANDYHGQMLLRRALMPRLLVGLRDALKRAAASDSPPKCQALSNITWALASMQLPDIPLIEMLAVQATNQLVGFKHFELSTTLWAFAKLGSIDTAVNKYSLNVFTCAAEYIINSADQFSFRGLVMIVWAFATARQHDPRLFRAIAAQLIPAVRSANCQELANTAWAFSTAGIHKERLFNRLAEEAIPRLTEFKPQELSSILWSFASIGFCHEQFFEAAANAVPGMQLQAQQLANILWALTRARARLPSTQRAVLALLPRCTELIKTFKPQELASVALAAAKAFGQRVEEHELEVPAPIGFAVPPEVTMFFRTALPKVAPDLSDFSGQSVANIANSFLAVQIGLDSELFPAVGYEVMIRAEKLENAALLLLLRTLPQAPRSAPVHGAICMLFGEAARRINILQPREVQVLSRICNALVGVKNTGAAMHPKELCECCLNLAKTCGSSPKLMDTQLVHLMQDHGAQNPCQHVFSKGEDPVASEAAEDPSAASGPWYEHWAAPMTIAVATPHGHSTAWDDAATAHLRQNVADATALREAHESAVGEHGTNEGGAESSNVWVSESPDRSALPHFVFSVKNTFLDVTEDEDKEKMYDEESTLPVYLPPPLSIIPDSVSPEKLASFRADYARFRVGNAIGAKGELTTTTVG